MNLLNISKFHLLDLILQAQHNPIQQESLYLKEISLRSLFILLKVQINVQIRLYGKVQDQSNPQPEK